jgi:multidrug efflux pump subunit AcrA (membrane-fusion protein)
MKCKLLLCLLLLSGSYLEGCKHPEIDGGATKKTFVLSDTMLKTIRIDTATMQSVLMEVQLAGKVMVNNSAERKTDVLIDVAGADLNKIKQGDDAEIITEAQPEKVFHGKIDGVYPQQDTVAGRLSIRLDDGTIILKPEMLTEIILHCDEGDAMIAIPETAVIADHSKNFVLVFKDKYNIQVREVETYTTTGDIIYISKGLDAGENVISAHQQQIYDALSDN